MGLVGRSTAVLLSGAALAVVMGTAFANAQETQTTAAEKQGRVTLLQRLVVGAGVEKVAIDTPQAVTVVDQEDIDREAPTTFKDVLEEVPGVQVLGSDRVLGEAFNIRGIGATENSADAARIVVTVDGAPKFNEQYRMGSFFADPELYKRVEILRGPASSTLYGAGALGGVINFTTKDASDFIADGDRGAVRVKSGYESNGDGTLVSGIWAHRFGDSFETLVQGNWRQSDEFEKADGKELVGSDFSAFSGLLKGTYRIDDEAIVRASYQRWDSSMDDQPYTQTFTTDGTFGLLDRHVIDQTYVLSYENAASDNPWLDLNVALTYSDTQNQQGESSTSGVTLPGLGTPSPTSPNNLAILFPTDYAYKTVQLKADNTFDYTGESFENFLTVGFQASHQLREAGRDPGTRALPAHPEGTENKLGLFVQNEFTWDDRLTIIPGARVDFYEMEPESSVAQNTPNAREVTGTAFSPKIAALYKLNDNFGVFGSIAHTERFPTLDELYSVNYASVPFVTRNRDVSLGLTKEKSDNYEIGFATSLDDIAGGSNSVGFKATAFYNDITDGIRTNPASGQIPGRPAGTLQPSYININAMEIWGIELEGSYESETVFGRLAYTHLEGEYKTGYTRGTGMGAVTVVPGQDLETIPQDKLVLTLGGRIPDRGITFGGTAIFAFEPTYQTPLVAQGQPFADGPSGSWSRLDLFASWKPTEGKLVGWEGQVAVQNVFDSDYRENLLNDRSRGRNFKFTLVKQFGYQ